MNNFQLNPEQFAFMQAQHERIERAYDAARRGHDDELLNLVQQVTTSDVYRQIIGAMGWDDAYDRYEDTPGYNPQLRQALIEQFQRDIEAESTAKSHFTNGDSELERMKEYHLVKLKDILDDE